MLAHRGLWREPAQMNSPLALAGALAAGFGLETDIRDREGHVVVSHDPPCGHASTLRACLDPGGLPPGAVLALNVKSDGLLPALRPFLDAMGERAFVFDMSVPEQRRYAAHRCFTRQSDLEPVPALYPFAAGVWLDSFASEWWGEDLVACHLALGKQVAIVSPELHGRDPEPRWRMLREAPWRVSPDVFLCTDFPERCQELLHG